MTNRASTLTMLGETMLVLQKVERFLAAVLMHMATPAEADGKLAKALLRDKETLGRLLNHFGERTDLPSDFALVFESLLRDRNVFVHSLFMQPWFDLNTPEGCTRLEDFMRALRTGAKIATKVMMAALTPKETDAPRSSETQSYIDSVFLRIEETAHPDVRARVSDQYIDRVREDSIDNFSVKRRDA
jgi:hypothetical protein